MCSAPTTLYALGKQERQTSCAYVSCGVDLPGPWCNRGDVNHCARVIERIMHQTACVTAIRTFEHHIISSILLHGELIPICFCKARSPVLSQLRRPQVIVLLLVSLPLCYPLLPSLLGFQQLCLGCAGFLSWLRSGRQSMPGILRYTQQLGNAAAARLWTAESCRFSSILHSRIKAVGPS